MAQRLYECVVRELWKIVKRAQYGQEIQVVPDADQAAGDDQRRQGTRGRFTRMARKSGSVAGVLVSRHCCASLGP